MLMFPTSIITISLAEFHGINTSWFLLMGIPISEITHISIYLPYIFAHRLSLSSKLIIFLKTLLNLQKHCGPHLKHFYLITYKYLVLNFSYFVYRLKKKKKVFLFFFPFFFKFYFIFKLYKIVLVLPNIKMNPPQVYMCYPS